MLILLDKKFSQWKRWITVYTCDNTQHVAYTSWTLYARKWETTFLIAIMVLSLWPFFMVPFCLHCTGEQKILVQVVVQGLLLSLFPAFWEYFWICSLSAEWGGYCAFEGVTVVVTLLCDSECYDSNLFEWSLTAFFLQSSRYCTESLWVLPSSRHARNSRQQVLSESSYCKIHVLWNSYVEKLC